MGGHLFTFSLRQIGACAAHGDHDQCVVIIAAVDQMPFCKLRYVAPCRPSKRKCVKRLKGRSS